MFGKNIGWPCKIVQLPISNLEGQVTDERRDRDLKQTDAAAVNKQISIQTDSKPSEFVRPLTSITLTE